MVAHDDKFKDTFKSALILIYVSVIIFTKLGQLFKAGIY